MKTLQQKAIEASAKRTEIAGEVNTEWTPMNKYLHHTEIDDHKIMVAEWISGCDDMLAEIEFLLDKAYPDGAEDRFYRQWEIVLEHMSVDS